MRRIGTKTVILTIPSGQNKSAIEAVASTPAGVITRIAARQISGTNTAATLYVFNTSEVAVGDELIHSIVTPITISSGQSVLDVGPLRWFYNNLDDPNGRVGFYVQVRIGSNASQELKYKVQITWMTND